MAQSGNVIEGALEFVLPTGARAMGMGQATVASAAGSEALWWNPALLANAHRELSGHFAQQSADKQGTDVSAAFVYPVPRLGAFAFGYRYLNYGEQDATGSDPNAPVSTFVPKSTVLMFAFAPTLTNRISAGVTYKLVAYSFDCTGSCNTPSAVPTTFALDFGGTFLLSRDSLIMVAAAVRNVGLPLQINDAPQADDLPKRADVGLLVSPRFAQWPEGRLRVSGDIVSRLSGGGSPGLRIGAELSYRDRVEGRLGYIKDGPPGSGPTVGLGVSTGKLQIDFAQLVSDIGSQAGAKPTYLSLRYIF